jgi:chemotaxis protein CheX
VNLVSRTEFIPFFSQVVGQNGMNSVLLYRFRESILDTFARIHEGSQPVSEAIHDLLVEPFISATTVALGEMAGASVVVQMVCQKELRQTLGDVSAIVRLKSASSDQGLLVFDFPTPTAASLAAKVLAEVGEELREDLIRDCMGELANVIAGQAKALLAGTPYQFVFSTPMIFVGVGQELPCPPDWPCLIVACSSDHGDFALQLFWPPLAA